MTAATLGGASHDDGRWIGRTSLVATRDALREEANAYRDDPDRWTASMVFLEQLRAWEQAPPAVDAPVPAAPDEPGSSRYVGWTPPVPPEPYWLPPIPLELDLAATGNRSPIAALAPWWDLVALPAEAGSPTAQLRADRLGIDAWRYGGWSPCSILGAASSVAASLDVHADALHAWRSVANTTEVISGPGLIGSLVPLYAEARLLASSLTARTEHATFGTRVPFEFISAITLDIPYATTGGVFGGKAIKAVVAERGYGECQRYTMAAEIADGWRPLRLALTGPGLPVEQEHQPIEQARWLARYIAHHRCHTDPAAASDPALHALAATGATPEPRFDLTRKWAALHLRIPLPRARPISALLG